jgi:hypothetical protein
MGAKKMELSKNFYKLEDYIGSDKERLLIIRDEKANLKNYVIKIDEFNDVLIIAKNNKLESIR